MEFKVSDSERSAQRGRAILARVAERERSERAKAARKRKPRPTPEPGSDTELPAERRRRASRCARLHGSVARDKSGLCAACSLLHVRSERSRPARGRKSRGPRGRGVSQTRDHRSESLDRPELGAPKNARQRRDRKRLIALLARKASEGDTEALARLQSLA